MQRLQLTPPHEPSLLHRIAAGDSSAKTEFVMRYGGMIWSVARRFEAAEVEAAVREILLDVWRTAAQFDPDATSESAYVAIIARRRLVERRRARGRPSLKAVPEPLRIADQTSQVSDSCSEATLAARALRELAPEQRSVVVLATCHDMSHSEVAAQTGVDLRTVKARIRTGLRSIRDAVLAVPPKSRKQP